jgi:hypothetical protein
MKRRIEGWSFLVGGAVLATFGLLSDANLWMLIGGGVVVLIGIFTLERRPATLPR